MEKLVSIIIPVYQGEKYIGKCLETVINQSYKDIEIIIINDGSTDRSMEIIEKYLLIDDRIKVFEQPNKGLSVARNQGLKICKGDYLVFVDSDDWVHRNIVANLVSLIDGKTVDVVVPVKNIFVEESTLLHKKVQLLNVKGLRFDDPKEYVVNSLFKQGRNWSVARGAIYRSDIIKKNSIEFPEGQTAEDIVFNLKFFGFANQLLFNMEPHYYYLRRQGSLSRSFRCKLIDTYLFIDQEARQFVEEHYPDKRKGNNACNQLLCRNVILYTIQYMQFLQYRPFSERYSAVLDVLSDKRVSEAFINTSFIFPYWPSFFKRLYVFLLHLLLKRENSRVVALHLIDIVNKISKVGI